MAIAEFGRADVTVKPEVPGIVPPQLWADCYCVILKTGVRVYVRAGLETTKERNGETWFVYLLPGREVAAFRASEVAAVIQPQRGDAQPDATVEARP